MDEDGTREERQPQPEPKLQPQLLRKSCDYCARMKRACDGGSPCSLCCRRGKTCERRLRRKSGPSKGAKYAPRRRKLDDEVALTEEEAAAAAAAVAVVVAVAATRGARRCSSTGGAREKLRPARSHAHGLSSREREPMRASSMKHEQEEKEKGPPPVASTTQPQQGLWGGGGQQRAAEGARRGSRCSASSSGSSAAPYYSVSSHGLPPQRAELSSIVGVEASHVAASGGGARVFVSPSRDRARHSSSSVEDRLGGGGGGGDDHPGALGRSSSSSSDGVAPPSSAPSSPPLPLSACTSYSSRGTLGRVVSASPLKGAGVGGGEAPGRGKAGEGGEVASRVQAIERSVRARGVHFHLRPHRDGAAAEQPPPHGGGGGSGSQPPGEQQPLAPRDLLLMLRPDDERVIDIIADSGQHRSWVPTAVTAAADRQRSWSNDSRTFAEAGELLRGIRRDWASAVAANAAAAAATVACRKDRPDESGSNGEDTAVARSPAAHSGRRGCGGDAPAPAGPPGDWPLDSVEGCQWRGHGGRPLHAGRRGSGAGFAFGEHVHRGAGGWPTQARASDNLYVGSALLHHPPHGDGDGRCAPMWHYDGNHVLESYPIPVHAGGGQGHHHHHQRHRHRHHHHLSAAAHHYPPSCFTPHHFPDHEIHQPRDAPRAYPRHSLAAGVIARDSDSGGGARELGGVGIRTRPLLLAGEWTAAGPNPAAASFPKVIPLPPPAAAGARRRRGSGDGGGGKEAGVSAGGNWSARQAPAPAPTDARFSHGDAKGGDGAPWRVRSDGPFRKRGKVSRAA